MRTLGLFIMVIFLIPLVGSSYAYSVESELEKKNFFIYAQIELRNSQDQLVGYLESKSIVILDLAKLDKLLDQNSGGIEKSTIVIGGKQWEMIKGVGAVIHSSPTVVSQSIISNRENGTSQNLVYANHDGYPVSEGDKVVTTWTIIRPLH